MKAHEKRLLDALQENYGTHFVNTDNIATLFDDVTNLIVARKSFGPIGDHPYSKLLAALDCASDMVRKWNAN